ncbi:SCF ubiquitin ligase complex subunit cdc4 [Quaeritorhiza haematococci]|nr:SCF ubiquitin ligase complex subunit cdc4 [Quaeritorhiza haematococci]
MLVGPNGLLSATPPMTESDEVCRSANGETLDVEQDFLKWSRTHGGVFGSPLLESTSDSAVEESQTLGPWSVPKECQVQQEISWPLSQPYPHHHSQLPPAPVMSSLSHMIATFASLPTPLKSFLLHHLLRQSPFPTLQLTSQTLNRILKRDFLSLLPVELSYDILGYLDLVSLGRCGRVCKKWREVCESEGVGAVWRERLIAEGWFDSEEVKRESNKIRKERRRRSERIREESSSTNNKWVGFYTRAYEGQLFVKKTAGLFISTTGTSQIDAMKLDSPVDSPVAYPTAKLAPAAEKQHSAGNIPQVKRSQIPRKRSENALRIETASNNKYSQHQLSPTVRGKETPLQQSPADDADTRPLPIVYESLYRRHHLIRQNWVHARYKRTSFPFPGSASHVVTCLQFDADKIVSGSDDATIHIYDTRTGQLRTRLEGHEGGVWALEYWGDVLVSGSTDRSVRVWDLRDGKCVETFEGHTSTVRCLTIIRPNSMTNENKPVRCTVGKEKKSKDKLSAPVIVTGSRDATLRVWRLPNIYEEGDDKSATSPYSPMVTTPVSTTASAAAISSPQSNNGGSTPYFLHLLTGHTNSVRALAGHDNILVSGSYDTTVRVWDLATGQNMYCFRGHREKVYSVGYSHELERAVSGSLDATVRIWCTKTGTSLFCLEGHQSLVGLLELSPTYLVSAAADATLRIWCPITGKCLSILSGHNAAITCFHHDPKLNRVVSGSDGGLRVWELCSTGYNDRARESASLVAGREDSHSSISTQPSNSTSPSSSATSHPPQSTSRRSTTSQQQRPTNNNQKQQTPPVYGRMMTELVKGVQGVWRVRMDEQRMVSAVQRENGRTWFEVLDFGYGVADNSEQEHGSEVREWGDERAKRSTAF